MINEAMLCILITYRDSKNDCVITVQTLKVGFDTLTSPEFGYKS